MNMSGAEGRPLYAYDTWSRETDGSIESGDRVKPSNAGTGTTRTPSLTSDQEAIALFKAFHARNSPYCLGPGRFVLLGEDHTWSRALVPFWVFKGLFRYQYKFPGDSGWSPERRMQLDEKEQVMQACATFKYRYDFVDSLKGEHVLGMKLGEDDTYDDKLKLFDQEKPEMSRGLAWDFVLRNVEHELRDRLQKQYQSTDIRIRVIGVPQASRQVFFPVHIIHYSFGEKVDVHNERSKDQFYALVGGFGGRVASETHVSVRKAAAVGGGLAIGYMALASVIGYKSALGWSGFDYGFIGAGSAALGALLAQVLRPGKQAEVGPSKASEKISNDWDALDDLYRREWSRWSLGSIGFDVEQDKRRRWAESIWSGHRNRMKRFQKVLEDRAASQRSEREREKRRERMERRWGPVEHRIGSGKRHRDYLGYYAALGLTGDVDVPKHEIKKAFLRKVRILHPDSHQGEQQASQEWLKVVEAYDVLRDEEKRKKYDSGEATRQDR